MNNYGNWLRGKLDTSCNLIYIYGVEKKIRRNQRDWGEINLKKMREEKSEKEGKEMYDRFQQAIKVRISFDMCDYYCLFWFWIYWNWFEFIEVDD